MLPNQPVQQSSPFKLRVLNGDDQGVEYRLVSQQISIGRSDDCTIKVNDPKASRNHVVLYLTPEGVQVINVSKNNVLIINGTEVENAIAPAGSIIKIGSTKFELLDERAMTKPKKDKIAKHAGLGGLEPQMSRAKPKENKTPIIVGGIVLILVVFLLLSPSKEKGEEEIRTDARVEQEIRSAQERQNTLLRSREAQGKNTAEYREAQALYIQGFRDYREGNYGRAIDYFNGALSLYPEHALSRRYLNQSRTKLDELVQLTLLEANRHYEQKQFKQASSKYKQVMILIGNKNDSTYKEAYERYRETLLLIKEAF